MAGYICQLRRGTKEEWKTVGSNIIPLEGELVLELDKSGKGLHRLKIGDGINFYANLPYISVDSFIAPKPATIALYGGDAWTPVEGYEGRYTQDITAQLAGRITANSKVDLQPTPEQLYIFQEKDVTFTTVNEDGIVRVCAIGTRPLNNYENIQVTITEVVLFGITLSLKPPPSSAIFILCF